MHEKVNTLKGVKVIGYTTADVNEKVLVTPEGNEIELKAQGWTGF